MSVNGLSVDAHFLYGRKAVGNNKLTYRWQLERLPLWYSYRAKIKPHFSEKSLLQGVKLCIRERMAQFPPIRRQIIAP